MISYKILLLLNLLRIVKLQNLPIIKDGRQDVNIRELLMMSGQNPANFITHSNPAPLSPGMNPNNFPEIRPSNAPSSIDYDSNLYKQLISSRPSSSTRISLQGGPEIPEIIMQEKTIDNLLGFVKGVVLCGGDGWCGQRCCSTASYGSSQLQHRPNGLRRKQKICFPVCQPQCIQKCIEAAKILMQTKNSDSFKISSSSDGKNLIATIPLCRPACMPECKETCLKKKQRPMKVTCRHFCMPDCAPSCVASPPLMVPCITSNIIKECACPPGYVLCSKYTCCMRYRTMAVKYRKLLPGYLYADNSTTTSSLTNSTSTTTTTTTPPSEGLLSTANLNNTLTTAENFFSSFKSLLRPSRNETAVVVVGGRGSVEKEANDNPEAPADYEVEYDYDETVDAGKAEFDAVTSIP